MSQDFTLFKQRLEEAGWSKEHIEFILETASKSIYPKKYGLVWEEKEEVVANELKNKLPYFKEITEREISLGDENSLQHLLIEGDNYEALKLLQVTHKGLIDVIYIDPPYNTGKEFVYNDKLVDKEDSYRHSKWLSFMSKRLKLAYELLSDTGVIFISIDDHEMAQLKLLCDEVFGIQSFVSNLIWINNLKGRQIDKHLANVNEYILCYSKNINMLTFNKLEEADTSVLSNYSLEDQYSKYKRGVVLYNTNSKFNIETRKNLVYSIYFNPKNGECICRDEKYLDGNGKLILPEENLLGADYVKIIPPIRSTNGKRGCWRWSLEKFEKDYQKEIMIQKDSKGRYMAYTKDRLNSEGVKLLKYKNLITNISSSAGTTQLTSILGDKVFDYPKPKELIIHLLKMTTSKKSIVLDFFAGSGTTGHAVLELNKEDGGHRQFILCTNNENNICEEVTYERLKRVIHGYTTPKAIEVEGLPANLKYLKVDKLDQNIHTDEDLSYLYMSYVLPLLQLKHNAFTLVAQSEGAVICEKEGFRFGIASELAISSDFDLLMNHLKEFEGDKILYVFSTDTHSYPKYQQLSELDEIIQPIPRDILNLLKGV